MSVLIKGMEMPTSCESCPCKTSEAFGGLGCQATGYIPLRKANQDRPDGCPLIEIPPHGRLNDADEAKPFGDGLDVCPVCGKPSTIGKPQTNYDRIISKTPEDLAEWIAGGVLDLTGGSLKMATEAWLDWLWKEEEEGEA